MSLEKTSRARQPQSETEGVQKTQEHERTSTRGEAGGTFDVSSWKFKGTERSTLPWGSLWAQPPSKARARQFVHPRQVGTFPKRLALPYPSDEILSGHEEDVSSIRDGFTAWVKTDPETVLRRHVVDAKGFYPAYREAAARRHEPSSQEYSFYDDVPNRLTEQRRLSVYKWNLDFDVERKGMSKGILRKNGTSSPYRKQLNTSSTIS